MPRGDERPGFRYLALGTEFAAAVVGLTLVGLWIDNHFGTSPWAVVSGAAVGLIGGMFNLVRELLGAIRRGADGAEDDAGDSPSRDGRGGTR